MLKIRQQKAAQVIGNYRSQAFAAWYYNRTKRGLRKDLVAYWNLDEASGPRRDVLGIINLTDNNTVTSAPGKVGNAASFDSANLEYLSCAHHPSLAVTTHKTIAGWLYLTDKTVSRIYISKGNTNIADLEIRMDYDFGSDRFRFYLSDGTSIKSCAAASLGSPSINTWYFFCAQYNFTSRVLSCSFNNGPVDTGGTPLVADPINLGGPFAIGRRAAASSLYWHGMIDEVGIWNRLLSASEISQLYNAGLGKTYPFL
jgi:hypothetical protein